MRQGCKRRAPTKRKSRASKEILSLPYIVLLTIYTSVKIKPSIWCSEFHIYSPKNEPKFGRIYISRVVPLNTNTILLPITSFNLTSPPSEHNCFSKWSLLRKYTSTCQNRRGNAELQRLVWGGNHQMVVILSPLMLTTSYLHSGVAQLKGMS